MALHFLLQSRGFAVGETCRWGLFRALPRGWALLSSSSSADAEPRLLLDTTLAQPMPLSPAAESIPFFKDFGRFELVKFRAVL